MLGSYEGAMVDRAVEAGTAQLPATPPIADRRGYGRTGRLPCGSLRDHEAHEWTGQTTGLRFVCSGHPPTFPERARLADRRLHEETNGITDSWLEEQ